MREETNDSVMAESSNEVDSMEQTAKMARMPKNASGKRVEEELCIICGDRASGYHYNVLSCEGCKGFFRRSVLRSATYECKYGGNCAMDMWMRRKCQACRLQRCRDVGMKQECLFSGRQCESRTVRKKKPPKSPANTLNSVSASSSASEQKPETSAVKIDSPENTADLAAAVLNRLSDSQRQIIMHLVTCQTKYELPTPDDITRIQKLSGGMLVQLPPTSLSVDDQIYCHMVEMTMVVTHLIVESAKQLPGFDTLTKDDQIILLKGSASEVMMIRTARRYNPDTNTIVFGDGQPFTRDCMSFGGLQDYVDSMFVFSFGMSQLQVDNTEYALITAICIFSERPGIEEPSKVEKLQQAYADMLRSYVMQRRKNSVEFFAKLLLKLVDLRTLSNDHMRQLYRLTIEHGSLPPLLREYFDLPDDPESARLLQN